jgi:hypothetical protein
MAKTDTTPPEPRSRGHKARNVTLAGLLGLFVVAVVLILLRRTVPGGMSAVAKRALRSK